ncbi:MAG: tRNA pseudouridine(38-40) synthase TruA [Sphingobacteriales bacterium]|nr:MAG: tRNA pseudouridine(38-40) synthase TruA [Sphingobacteriales bacterium]
MRYFLEISYKGTNYHGWQIQPNALTVQQVLNQKLSLLLGEEIYCIGCGRTDTGVHAKQFFLHFDVVKAFSEDIIYRLNKFLPKDIAALNIYKVADEAHTRWSAIERTYTYFIARKKDPFQVETAAQIIGTLDIEKMNEAAQLLLQYQEFHGLSKINEQEKHHLCDIKFASWHEENNMLVFTISANRFLRGMVRIIVGSLLEIGKGKKDKNWLREVIESKDCRKAGSAAPAEGLYLSEVKYPNGMLNITF